MIYDINLIPKSKKLISSKIKFATIVLCICCIALLISFGFYLPFEQKNLLNNHLQELESELLTYSSTQETYITLSNQIDELSRTDLMLGTIKSSNLKMTEIMDELEKSIPRDITINSMSLEAGLLTIEGVSPSYMEMAKFIVNLRSMEKVLNVTFMSAVVDTGLEEVALEEETLEESIKKEQFYNFTIYVRLDVTDVLSQLLLDQANTMVNEGEEAIQSETNE